MINDGGRVIYPDGQTGRLADLESCDITDLHDMPYRWRPKEHRPMTRQEAMEAARVFLSRRYTTVPPTIVVREEWTEEHAWAWRVVFDVQEFLDTGDGRHRPMSRALYVRKDTGEVAYVPPVMSTQMANEYLETGVWPYGPGAGR